MFKRDDKTLANIRAHSSVLMLSSPVFQKMLTLDMKEKEAMQIELPGKCPEEFKVLLQFLQPVTGRLQKVSTDNVDFLLRWCDEYCINSLYNECLEFIKGQPPSMEVVVLAHCWGLHDTAEGCIDRLLKRGVKDWSKCYTYPKLVQKVLERNLKPFDPMINVVQPLRPRRRET